MRIHALRTGSVRVRPSQVRRRPGGVLRVLADAEWTAWLPIYAWAIEHHEGVILVDTGESARASTAGYFPEWHPYYRRCVQFEIEPDQEAGPQLASVGLGTADVRMVVLTHLHTDHTGGLAHFPRARTLVSRPAYRSALGRWGRVQGYQPEHWPPWFAPEFIRMEGPAVGPFPASHPLTRDADIVVLPTPGHTPGHLSVLIRDEGVSHLLAGDVSYSERALFEGTPDGLTLQPSVLRRTQGLVRALAAAERLVYLPTHDSASAERLESGTISAAPGRHRPPSNDPPALRL